MSNEKLWVNFQIILVDTKHQGNMKLLIFKRTGDPLAHIERRG